MITLPSTVYVATAPINLALSFDRLAGLAREVLGGDPRSTTLFIFHNRRRTHLKLLWHDGGGYCVLYKRLDRGQFRIPSAPELNASRVVISERELRVLLEGIDMALIRTAQRELRASTR